MAGSKKGVAQILFCHYLPYKKQGKRAEITAFLAGGLEIRN